MYNVTFNYLTGDLTSDNPKDASIEKEYAYNANLPDPGVGDFETLGHKYKFVGWEPELVSPVVGEASYTAKYEVSVKQFTITWVTTEQDEDGKLFEVRTDKAFDYGASLEGEFPAVYETFYTTEEVYTFARWSPEPKPTVVGDQVYTAEYQSEPREYAITWMDDEEAIIDVTLVAYGTVPKHDDPTKPSTAQFDYLFAGWDPEVVAVTGEAIYKAVFIPVYKQYTITWMDDVGGVYDTTKVEYGQMPKHDDPTKPADGRNTYEFAGWTPEIVAVTGDATYTATFTATPIPYVPPKLTVPERSAMMNRNFKVYFGETPDTDQHEPALVVEWGQTSGVAKYEIFAYYLGDDIPSTPAATLSSNTVAAFLAELNGEKIDSGKVFAVFMVAKNGNGVEVGRTVTAFVAGPDSEYANPVALNVASEKSITLEVGQSSSIQASVSYEDSTKQPIPDVPELRYVSNKENVATVSASGEIVAVGKGTCIIQVFTANALVEEIKVTVK